MTAIMETLSSYRYFYTDPLAASWMAKHFGMKFCNDDLEWTLKDIAYFEYVQADRPDRDDPPVQCRSFYVHPDSLHLLEPQTRRDICLMGMGGAMVAVEFYFDENERDSLISIIQRDGKAFHWPESEAV